MKALLNASLTKFLLAAKYEKASDCLYGTAGSIIQIILTSMYNVKMLDTIRGLTELSLEILKSKWTESICVGGEGYEVVHVIDVHPNS